MNVISAKGNNMVCRLVSIEVNRTYHDIVREFVRQCAKSFLKSFIVTFHFLPVDKFTLDYFKSSVSADSKIMIF